jgi:hypothetical protein
LPAIRAPRPGCANRQIEHRLEQPDGWIADRELRRMHANRDASGASVAIVAGQRHLSALVELARFSESERMSRDHESAEKRASKLRQRFRFKSGHR